MTSATTTLEEARGWGLKELSGLLFGGVNQTDKTSVGKRVVMVTDSCTIYRRARFFQSAADPYTILVDAVGPESFSDTKRIETEYQRVVRQLQENGRELVAEEVYEMLLASKEPDGDPIQLFSLRAMADFLVQHRNIVDPIVGPSPYGIMQLEWHILGDGLLVIAFVENEQVHCVVQADAAEQDEAMDVSERMSSATLIERFGYLIPIRDDETR